MTDTLCIPSDNIKYVLRLIESDSHIEVLSVENYVRELMGVVYVTVKFDRPARLFDLMFWNHEHRKPE